MTFDEKTIAQMIEAAELDAGQHLPGLEKSLREYNEGKVTRHSPESILLKKTRAKLTMTQNEFANLIKTPIGTLRDWEQGRVEPSGVAVTLAGLLNKYPDLAREVQ